jgi:hypothetical protein
MQQPLFFKVLIEFNVQIVFEFKFPLSGKDFSDVWLIIFSKMKPIYIAQE